jgi:magnesium-transporting ATPase (P-type)
MIGDGVNDILAIKHADLGIAMGTGSTATKTVAGLVLENDDFGLLPATFSEGQTILRNLRRAAKLFLLKNVYTLFLIVIAVGILGFEFPYLPQQVTLLNALTIGGPAFLIMFGRGSNSAHRTDFIRDVSWFSLSSGCAMGIAGLVVWLISNWGLHQDPQLQRTILLSTLVLTALGNVIIIVEGEAIFWGWFGIALVSYLGSMYIKTLANFLILTPLDLRQWGLVLSAVVPTSALCFLLNRKSSEGSVE